MTGHFNRDYNLSHRITKINQFSAYNVGKNYQLLILCSLGFLEEVLRYYCANIFNQEEL